MAPHKDQVASRGLVLRNRVISKGIIYIAPKKQKTKGESKERRPLTLTKSRSALRSKTHRTCNLNSKRMRKITNFLKKMHLKPGEQLGTFWSEKWIISLLKHMREPKRSAPTVEDVRRWLKSTNFFEETIRKILSELPPQLPPVEVSTDSSEFISEMNAMELSDSSIENDACSTHAKSERGNENGEHVRGKTGWNASRKNLDEEESGTSGEESQDDSGTSVLTDNERVISSVDQLKVKVSGFDYKEEKGNLASVTQRPTFSNNTDKHKDVISIFPEGFKWKGTVRQSEKRKQQDQDPIMPAIPQKKPQLQMTVEKEQKINAQGPGSLSDAEMTESPSQPLTPGTSSETSESIRLGTFVTSIPLTAGVIAEYFPEDTALQTPAMHEEVASNGNQTFAVYGEVTNDGSTVASCFTASTAEEVLAAMIKSGTLVLHAGNETLDGELNRTLHNDHAMVQLHANKIIEIASRNASQQGFGQSWNTVLYCATLLNMILEGRF